jgi:predicted transcriptional regulator of viral defense system
VVRLRRGLWTLRDGITPFLLPSCLTSPNPCYLSLQTALFYYGIVRQVPQRVFVVSPGRSRQIRTPLAVVSVHHVSPAWFAGFVTDSRTGVSMATREKALADFLYLASARSRLFAALPELDLPRDFRWAGVRRFLRRIAAPRRRVMAERRLAAIADQPFAGSSRARRHGAGSNAPAARQAPAGARPAKSRRNGPSNSQS